MNKKMFYEAPDAELIELNLENNQMNGASGTNNVNDGYDNDNDLGEI